jgi:hypothetical protein
MTQQKQYYFSNDKLITKSPKGIKMIPVTDWLSIAESEYIWMVLSGDQFIIHYKDDLSQCHYIPVSEWCFSPDHDPITFIEVVNDENSFRLSKVAAFFDFGKVFYDDEVPKLVDW